MYIDSERFGGHRPYDVEVEPNHSQNWMSERVDSSD